VSILVIAPHADDEILGAGGTIARAVACRKEVYVCVVTRGCMPLFSDEYVDRLRDETKACHGYLGVKETFFLDFPSVMLESEKRFEVNARILEVIRSADPTEVYIPHSGDMQKDHQIVADAAMVALRPKYGHRVERILAYETLSETGWNIPSVSNEFTPNVYSDISGFLGRKTQAMMLYESQLCDFPSPRSIAAIEALARYRGSTVQLHAAEAFRLIREVR